MMSADKKCCVPCCGKTRLDNVILHTFPNPDKQAERFRLWIDAIGGDILALENQTIYKNRRVCHDHFEAKFFTSSKRLTANSVPTLQLSGSALQAPLMDDTNQNVRNIQTDVEIPSISKGSALRTPLKDITVANQNVRNIQTDMEIPSTSKELPTHVFPDYHKYPELFKSWVATVDGKLEKESDYEYYRKKIVCNRHFQKEDHNRNNRLNRSAVPLLYLGKSKSDHTYFKDAFHNDHSYFRKVTNLTPAGDTSFKREIHRRIYSAKENRQDNNLQKAADATPSGKDAKDIAKTEESTAEPSIFDDDFAPRSPSPSSPVPKIEDKSMVPKTLFSWQKPELIPADDVEEPPTLAELEEKTGISLFCDDTPAPQTVPQVPETSIKEVEYRCKDCRQIIDGFQFWCVQCFGCALCGACEARGEHRQHYVLRAPPHRPYKQTQVVLATIRHQLQNENMLAQLGPADGVKLEVKEEPTEEDCSIVNTAPVEPDPLDAADPLRHEPHHTTAAEETTHRPFKRPRLADYTEKEFSTRGTPLPVKVTSRPKSHEEILINLDDVDDQVVFVTEELETDDTRDEHTEIDTEEETGEVSDDYMEIETLDDDIDSDSSVEDDDSIDSRIVEDEDGDETLEVLEDVDSRIDEDTDVVTMINETDRIVEAENILSDLTARRVSREEMEVLRTRGSPESMVRTLTSEAVVELRPLSSVEITKWKADSMKRRK